MDLVTALSRTIPFALASGVNLYATVAVIGLCSRFGWVALPEQFKAFEHPALIAIALALYLVEFLADKIPWLDSAWDAVHTVVRPVGGAFVAVTALGEATPTAQALIGLLGGSVAMTTHLSKAGTRAAVNVSPEPFTNWGLSLAEDLFVVGFSYVALQYPYLALLVSVVVMTAIVLSASLVIRAMRRRFRSIRHPRIPNPTIPTS
jgi:hypothetical protein